MKENEFHLLLWKNLKGTISQIETEKLNIWLAESSDNQLIADEIELIWFKTNLNQKSIPLNLDSEYNRLQQKIKSEEESNFASTTLTLWRRHWLKIAASLLFLMGSFWAFNKFNQSIQPSVATNWVRADQGVTKKVELPDGSVVWLSQGSDLIFPAYFNQEKRHVSLKGTAFFEVFHNPNQPFSVSILDGSVVEVLGTKFNINASNGDETSVFVESGKVRFSNTAQEVVLIAQQKGVFNHKTKTLKATESTTQNDLAWYKGGLSFVKTPLTTVVKDFQDYYGIVLEIDNKSLLNCTFSAPVLNQNVADALKTIALSFDFKITQPSSNKYILTGGNCR
jgi:transmembrane sensor